MIYALFSLAAPYVAWAYDAYCRRTQRTAKHAGRWRPLPHRRGSLTAGVLVRVGSEPAIAPGGER